MSVDYAEGIPLCDELAVRVGFERTPLIDNAELVDSALLQILQMHKMLYIITPDYTQTDNCSPPRRSTGASELFA
jgi:hypothetical protein